MRKAFIKPVLLGAASLSALTLPAIGQAQSLQLEEVVVTAQKREESLQDTPISLLALGPAQLEQRGITEVNDLQGNVPNLQITPHPNAGSTPRIFIRGVGNFDDQVTQDPSVALYIDGIYIARSQGMSSEVAEIERVEVLRGPQGTLYGRNATGGAINLVTRAPELGAWGFSQTFGVSDNNGFRSRTTANVPLGDSAAARLGYLTSRKDGAIKNAGTGEDYFGSEDREAARIDLRWQPTDALDIRYAYDRSTIGDTPAYFVSTARNPDPGRPSHGSAAVRNLQNSDITSDGHSLTVSWSLSDALTVKSLSAYRELDSYSYQDYQTLLISEGDLRQHQFSQEFQLIGSTLDQRLDYVAGVYYFTESADSYGVSHAGGADAANLVDIENTALAAYAQATWTPAVLGDRLHITPGLRWSKDEREAHLRNVTRLAATGFTVLDQSGHADRKFTNLSPGITVSYDLSETANVYAKYVEGYKTGGYNVRASSIARFEAGFDPEELASYELGIKSQWLDNRLRLNAAVFQADYDDIQINAQSDISDPSKSDVLNAGKATISGVELDITVVVAEGLTATLSYGYLDASYDEIIDGTGRDVTDDFDFINAPRHSYTLDVDYLSKPTPIGSVHFNVNYSWQDDKLATVSLVNGTYTIDDYGLLNARLALEDIPGIPAGSLRVALWGKNIEDKDYSIINSPLFGGQRIYGEPRSYGLEVTYEY